VTEYEFHSFWDVTSCGANISFCVFHPMTGVVHASFFGFVADTQFVSVTVDFYPGSWPRAYASPHHVVRLAEFCFGDGAIRYYARGNVRMTSLRVAADFDVPAEVHRHAITRDLADFMVHPHPVLFVSAAPADGRVRADLGVRVKNIEHMVSGRMLLNDTRGCFGDGNFLRAPGGVAIDGLTSAYRQSATLGLVEQLLWMITIRVEIMEGFRAVFTNKTIVTGIIVVD
jgi:hypothetical protein